MYVCILDVPTLLENSSLYADMILSRKALMLKVTFNLLHEVLRCKDLVDNLYALYELLPPFVVFLYSYISLITYFRNISLVKLSLYSVNCQFCAMLHFQRADFVIYDLIAKEIYTKQTNACTNDQ